MYPSYVFKKEIFAIIFWKRDDCNSKVQGLVRLNMSEIVFMDPHPLWILKACLVHVLQVSHICFYVLLICLYVL